MSKFDKLLLKLLSGTSDQNIGFEEWRSLLLTLGFQERLTGGSHRVFTKENITEIINNQPDGSKAKVYQVKQIRSLILKYKLSKYEK